MSLASTTEQRELQTSVRRTLTDLMPITRVREIAREGGGTDARLTKALTDTGIPALAVPEQYGGLEGGFHELVHVFEELGRSLTPTPYLATLGLGVPALLASGDEEALAEYLPKIATGQLTVAVAWVEPGGNWNTPPKATAKRTDDGWTVTGTKAYTLDGHTADLLLVLAGRALFAVAGDAQGVTRKATPTLDQTRVLGEIELSEAPARLIGGSDSGADLLATALDHAGVLLAAEMVGGAQACLDMSVEYAKIREQFGRPIGSFQAIKHKCAEILVGVEGARSAARYAGWTAGEDPAGLPVVSVVAKLAAAEAYYRAAAENVQIHGGIGFTWEHDAHLYFKRAESAALLFGDTSTYRRILADRIGI